jgi:hypothetical protein
MSDQAWTRFVRAWRAISHEHHRRWLDSPERIRALVDRHPLPWTIDQDWTWEVIASDGTCVEKKMTYGDALAFVTLAESL